MYATIRLERGDGSRVMYAKVDIPDLFLVERFTWHLSLDGHKAYAETNFDFAGDRISCTMHQLIFGDRPKQRILHVNGNSLDNRRENLRGATQSQILAMRRGIGGSSRYKGVVFDKETGKWLVQFRGRKVGRFRDEVEAAKAFDRAAYAYWGKNAYFNFPDLIELEML